MNDDYLWDRSGEPDPEVARLESLLGRYRHDAPLRRPVPVWRYAVAATVIFAVVSVAVFFALRLRWRAGEPWEILSVEGTPTIDGRVIDREARFAVGEELR
ncbi:MAG TPA: hypothetical protein VHL59_15125, partial [Thermoanaerobaculia bacterium]|nr:hypothetical protein [Thermoanaerobaculia bacterium]